MIIDFQQHYTLTLTDHCAAYDSDCAGSIALHSTSPPEQPCQSCHQSENQCQPNHYLEHGAPGNSVVPPLGGLHGIAD